MNHPDLQKYILPVTGNTWDGSSVLTGSFLQTITRILETELFASSAQLHDILRIFISTVKKELPSMASIINNASLMERFLSDLESKNLSEKQLKACVLKKVRETENGIAAAAEKITSIMAEIMPQSGVVATCSRSGLVEATFLKAAKRGMYFSVLLCESRPGNEGTDLAEKLADAGINVTLVTDAAFGSYIRKASLFITGADTISETGFINKIGTGEFVLACAARSVPVFVLVSVDKFIKGIVNISAEDTHPPGEVYVPKSDLIQAENPYFEWIPYENVTALITEYGVIPPERMKVFPKRY